MKARALIFQRLAREAFERGDSLREVAGALLIPLGTVKTWRSRGKWRRGDNQTGRQPERSGDRRSQSDRGNETPVAVGKPDDHETHRGLRACHMPGRKGSKQMTFALFKRGIWPPAAWKVPSGLVGGELLMMLQERACLGLEGKGRKGRGVGNG